MQQKAQQKLIELNLAYEEALKAVHGRPAALKDIPLPEAKTFARHLYENGHPESALPQHFAQQVVLFQYCSCGKLMDLRLREADPSTQRTWKRGFQFVHTMKAVLLPEAASQWGAACQWHAFSAGAGARWAPFSTNRGGR